MASVTSPVYISEISTAGRRGLLGSAVQLSITMGILLSYLTGMYTGWFTLGNLAITCCLL